MKGLTSGPLGGHPHVAEAEEWKPRLGAILSSPGRVHLVGVGNPMRSDDGVGLRVAALLRSALRQNRDADVLIHIAPRGAERLMSKLTALGGYVIIFDAVEVSAAPGEIVFRRLADAKYGFFGTHNIPFRLIPGVADQSDRVFLVGIQPESMEVGEGLSPAVRASAERVVEAVASALEGRP